MILVTTWRHTNPTTKNKLVNKIPSPFTVRHQAATWEPLTPHGNDRLGRRVRDDHRLGRRTRRGSRDIPIQVQTQVPQTTRGLWLTCLVCVRPRHICLQDVPPLGLIWPLNNYVIQSHRFDVRHDHVLQLNSETREVWDRETKWIFLMTEALRAPLFVPFSLR